MADLAISDNHSDRPAAMAAAYRLDDAAVQRQLDRLAKLAAGICNTPIGLVCVVFENQLLIVGQSGAASEGSPVAAGLSAEASIFCVPTMAHDGLMTVPDARQDSRFADDPLLPGASQIRFYAGQPLVSPDGNAVGSFCVVDSQPRAALTSEQAEALETLAEATMALLEKWRQATEHRKQSSATRARLAHMEQRFDVLVDALPQLVWSSLPTGVSDYFSAQWCKFTGEPARSSFGSGWMNFVHPDDMAPTAAAWDAAVASGGSYAVNYRLRRHDGEYVWMLARGLPICDDNGELVRWIGTCTDIQGQVQASELLEMMSGELNHRIKNLFAVTQGLISMTLRHHPEFQPVAGELQSRLRALGKAHDLVRPQFVSPHFASALAGQPDPSLHELLHTLLQPYASDERPRWEIVGNDLPVGEQAATPLALFVHELGTNSVKYGALSAQGGFVHITVAIAVGGEGAEQVAIGWQEHGGPPVIAPRSRGFGFQLAELSIVRQLGGSLEFDWAAGGLFVSARVPTAAISSDGRAIADSAVPHYAD